MARFGVVKKQTVQKAPVRRRWIINTVDGSVAQSTFTGINDVEIDVYVAKCLLHNTGVGRAFNLYAALL